MKWTSTIFLFLFSLQAYSQLQTHTSFTPQHLVQNVLVGQGISISNIVYTGFNEAIGYFQGNTIVGINEGVILTTGTVLGNDFGPVGPNNSSGAGFDNQILGDIDLGQIAGVQTWNAAILEFDFVPIFDFVEFKYAFGSEEYPEFAGSVNDVFGFFLSGPGINGPFSNNAVNIATLPGGLAPVTINTVNNGINNTGPCQNCQFYVANGQGMTPQLNNTLQYDGLTTVLTARYPVNCGATYHIKIAIADAMDGIFDSGVFLKAGSFTSQEIVVATISSNPNLGDSTLVEGCDSLTYKLTRKYNIQDTLNLQVSFSGSAINGVDFQQVPGILQFLPGDSTGTIQIIPVADGSTEGIENIIITIPSQKGFCNGGNDFLIHAYIRDEAAPIVVTADSKIFDCDFNPVPMEANLSGGDAPFVYSWGNGSTNTSTVIQPISNFENHFVTVSDRCGNRDTAFFTLQKAEFTFNAFSSPSGCGRDNGSLTFAPLGAAPFYFSLDTGTTFVQSNGFQNLYSGIYLVVGHDSLNCFDTVLSILNDLDGPIIDSFQVFHNLCFNDSSGRAEVFATTVQQGVLSYLWDDYLAQTTAQAANLMEGAYFVKVIETSMIDSVSCNSFGQVNLVAPPKLEYVTIKTEPTCKNNDGSIRLIPSGGTPPYLFARADSGIFTPNPLFGSLPEGPVAFIIEDANGCNLLHPDTLRSPVEPLKVLGQKMVNVCKGNQANISISASGGDGNYSFYWPALALSGNNINVSPSDTTKYVVILRDACGTPSTSDSISVNVIPLPVARFGMDSLNCLNDCSKFTDLSFTSAGTIQERNWTVEASKYNNKDISHCFKTSGNFPVKLEVKTSDGCTNSFTGPVNIFPNPVAGFDYEQILNQQEGYTVKYADSSLRASEYFWEFGDFHGKSNKRFPEYIFQEPGNYKTRLIVVDARGCTDTLAKTVEVLEKIHFYMPNSFTPNNDGLNDFIKPVGTGISAEGYTFELYNRWGERIFITNNPEEGWEGTHYGNQATAGVYVYKIKLKDLFDNQHEYSGMLNLIR